MSPETHTQRYPFCVVTYWNGNSASYPDETWTHCNVTPLGGYTHGEQTFQNTDSEIFRRDALLRFLEKAYERGRADAKSEIRDVLGIEGGK